ncbi:SidA/IucD/PvdA family monooxygenase [Streptomyces sp. PTM05]|uniref:L-lysine N6-monooxygenase MbtG n=1 Tax=Streptantibioticus parmotrematis TaxID=2873249 RepID=A0ABS7R1L1_9ACTN|nr:SidA/IucD/PvdA family monooxygenase [Streptantibioticus parmotrematis]MBY8889359.1 SidA/IucD/PvdA family monooxygenase [Streptantibioticus parmotrematis]
MTKHQVHPVLGVGFGPANLSLAVALEEHGLLDQAHFIERAGAFQWQDEQLLPGADIQNNPFRDLVMPRNPYSRHTFVNYLSERGMLTGYLHLNAKFPLRREYAGYLAWVAEAFGRSVEYGRPATGLTLAEDAEDAEGREVLAVETATGERHLSRNVVIGTGRSPRIPAVFEQRLGATVFHSTRYLSSVRGLAGRKARVAVVGASQSAIEIVLDLLDRPEIEQVVSIQRGIGFRLKDTSPYSRQVFLPEFVDYFHPLPAATRRRIRQELRSINYAACDQDVIDRLVGLQREYELTGCERFKVVPFSEVTEALGAPGGGHRLVVRDVNYAERETIDVDVVVLATGFRDFGTGPGDEPYHPLLRAVAHRLPMDSDGVPVVARDYSITLRPRTPDAPAPRVYLNGLCEASHGMGDAGALAMLSVRSTDIAGSLAERVGTGSDKPLVAGALR